MAIIRGNEPEIFAVVTVSSSPARAAFFVSNIIVTIRPFDLELHFNELSLKVIVDNHDDGRLHHLGHLSENSFKLKDNIELAHDFVIAQLKFDFVSDGRHTLVSAHFQADQLDQIRTPYCISAWGEKADDTAKMGCEIYLFRDDFTETDDIRAMERIIELLPETSAMKAFFFGILGDMISKISSNSAVKVLSSYESAANLSFPDDMRKTTLLSKYGAALAQSYDANKDMATLRKSIGAMDGALALYKERMDLALDLLAELGILYQKLFFHTGDREHINRAISLYEMAANITPDDHPQKSYRLCNLGILLRGRFKDFHNLDDINSSVVIHEKALELGPKDYVWMPTSLRYLGVSLQMRFERGTRDIKDLDAAISTFERILNLVPNGYAQRCPHLSKLSLAYELRFQHSGSLDDINKAILLVRECIECAGSSHAEISPYLNNLATSLSLKFGTTGDPETIDESINVCIKAIDLAGQEDDGYPSYVANLSDAYGYRFERFGNIKDIDKSIELLQKSVESTPDAHENKFTQLNNLSLAFYRRFGSTGDLKDIDDSILIAQRALSLNPTSDTKSAMIFNTLGTAYQIRFSSRNDISDINEAVAAHQNAVKFTPATHPRYPLSLNNLGVSLNTRWRHSKHLKDLDMAISILKTSISRTPEGHSALCSRLSNLGLSHRLRFEHTGNIFNADQAILVMELAVKTTPEDHSKMVGHVQNLANAYMTRYRHSHSKGSDDIERAISLYTQVLEREPSGDASRLMSLNNLGTAYLLKSVHTRESDPLVMAASQFRKSIKCVNASPSRRLYAARQLGAICDPHNPTLSLEGYSAALGLLPQVAWLGQTITDRYAKLRSLTDLTSEAVATAISFKQYETALEWLEQGRCIVWNQLTELRTPVDELREAAPQLCDKILQISQYLEQAGNSDDFLANDNAKRALSEELKNKQHRMAEEWETALQNARKIQGFEDFLKPLSFSDLSKRAPADGPIVVINVHATRCDALILTQGSTTARHVALHNVTLDRAETWKKSLQGWLEYRSLRMREARTGRVDKKVGPNLEDVLSGIWFNIAKPVIDELGYAPSDNPPRVWWCTTGPLSFLPIHAAGIYTSEASSHVSDYLVSSYTHTISVLLGGERPREFTGQLALGVSETLVDSLPIIPNTEQEISSIQQQFEERGLKMLSLRDGEATVKSVITGMENHSWVHFACHGVQNALEPMKSAFYLRDGYLELYQIIRKRLSKADFAYLSACETGTGHEKLSDEAIHLAAGLLSAGYRSVIATMWSINDEDAPTVAKDVYTYLLVDSDSLPNSSNASRALHYATRRLQESKSMDKASKFSWVPFIHFGI
ncbi:CHAT domain-containing protein [Crucibulum laeve]|uniref:CHAT domain-containing protein n=1 Tax=Crucibulum laeve TaxID=68775 RepID=A0A5C3LHF4_9AGAR|nr:CHAT domain-containing protein [Crucibulum laeve]